MVNFVNIHTHNPQNSGLEIGNFRLGADSARPESPFSAGIHPWDCGMPEEQFGGLISALRNIPCVAIGEIGLDKVCDVDWGLQKQRFQAQLIIAGERQLPVVIHCVRAFQECLTMLEKQALRGVVFHGFIGSAEVAKSIISKGYYLSFGTTAFASPKTLSALKVVPLERVFLETDTATTPIEELYTKVAQLRGIEISELKKIIIDNFNTIFR